MKILVMGDFHGKKPRGLKTFVKKNKIDLILSPGDVYGGFHTEKFEKIWEEHEDYVERGKYGNKNIDGLEDLVSKETFEKITKDLSVEGKEVLEYLNEIGLPVLLVPGNWDARKNSLTLTTSRFPIEETVKDFENITLLEEERSKDYNNIIGHLSNCPFIRKKHLRRYRRKDEKRIHKNIKKKRKEIRKKSRRLVKKNSGENIVLSHAPPYKTKLDKIENPDNEEHGSHVGDDILKSVIEMYQPLLNVCGHMHEHQGKCKVGKTLVVNSGFGKEGEFALIDVKGKKVKVEFKNLSK